MNQRFSDLPIEEAEQMIGRILESKLRDLLHSIAPKEEKLHDIESACMLLGKKGRPLSANTFRKFRKEKNINPVREGFPLMFKESDLLK